MSNTRRAGGVSKRCECRDPGGKLLGQSCPQLAKKNHGALALRQELPLDKDGKRRPFRRTGYGSLKDAQADLDRIRAILDLAGDDTDAQLRVGDLLADVMRDRLEIPEAVGVSRKLGVGVPLDGQTTLGEWLDTWVATKKTRLTTTKNYQSHIRVHLKPGIGHYRVDRFNVGHAQEFFDGIDDLNEVVLAENAARREQAARAKWGKASRPPAAESERLAVEREKLAAMPPYRLVTGPATKQRIRATLRTALNAAIKRQLITFNPAAHVELESGKRPKAVLWTDQHVARWRETGEKPSPVMVWTPPQVGAFLDVAEDDRLYAFFHLIAFRGLRRGEGVGQDWANIDLDRQTLTVAKEIVVDGWTPIETKPKTDGSAGTIGLDSVNVEVLREHRARQLVEKEKAGAKWVETGKAFTTPLGEWLHPEKVSETFRKICRDAELPPINLRDLRHCAATLIHAGGGDLMAIKETLRHSSIKLAGDTYTSLLHEVDLEIAERAAALVPRARKPAPVEAPAE
ncbi:site-specific integrase [Streptomyces sp. H39-C1]|uniref:site-specific integrase n=1 Tax=Streptomyces sp. H39-C1 TaxID=3004355 RepID=UPI0022AED292|nr:site-specific integrase [Streptomyces sp. H39-C1]MCZ4099876.1 site-specific integrase [Streptomyces sp. H39-C1]